MIMDKIIGTLSVALVIIYPLIRFYQRSNWTQNHNFVRILGLTILWFLVAPPLHELSHIIGTKIVGAKILDYQLLPKYWIGDFRNAYIKPDFDTKFQEFIIRTSPYLGNLIFASIGFIVLIKKRIQHPFIVGLLFSLLLLNSVFDIVSNFLGYTIKRDGDLNGLSKLIGHFWTYFISICIMIITMVLTYRIFNLYKGFPRIEKTDEKQTTHNTRYSQ